MDVLSDVLKKVKLTSAIYFKSDFFAPWGMEIPKGAFAQFHMVIKGACVLKFKNTSYQLARGDIVAFPLGADHWLADLETSTRRPGQEVVKSIQNGKSVFKGGETSTTLVCGHFEFDKNIDHPFIDELPEIIRVTDSEKKEFIWLENISNLILQEMSKRSSGSDLIVTKLGEVLFMHLLRAYIAQKSQEKGFLVALQDKRMRKVLKAIHSAPENDWKLVSLAQVAGMSRTSFSNHFKSLMGDTPFGYITQWRMLLAKELLKESTKSVAQIAEEVGYQSESAFNRVFKKRVSQTPLKFRQRILAS